jgi:diadenosine tetraphosphate (Ap4A) HIT family hydrolase
MNECIFCKFKNNSSELIYQNKNFYSRLDSYPISYGHSLIISKNHLDSFFDLNDEELSDFYEVLKETRNCLLKEFKPASFNIGINDGEIAGRTIPHLHIHLIPRYINDVDDPRGGIRNFMKNLVKYP